MDETRTLWPEPTGDSITHEERGSKLQGTVLFLVFHPPMKIESLKKSQALQTGLLFKCVLSFCTKLNNLEMNKTEK